MRTEIKELHQRLKTTTVYVTHDQIEAMTMADKIVVMHDGVVEQIGAPLDLYDRPANQFVAGFIGSPAMKLHQGRIAEQGRTFLCDGGAELSLDAGARRNAWAAGGLWPAARTYPHRPGRRCRPSDRGGAHGIGIPGWSRDSAARRVRRFPACSASGFPSIPARSSYRAAAGHAHLFDEARRPPRGLKDPKRPRWNTDAAGMTP